MELFTLLNTIPVGEVEVEVGEVGLEPALE